MASPLRPIRCHPLKVAGDKEGLPVPRTEQRDHAAGLDGLRDAPRRLTSSAS